MEYRSSIPERKSPDFPHDFHPTSYSFLPETVGNYRKNPEISVSEYGIHAPLISDEIHLFPAPRIIDLGKLTPTLSQIDHSCHRISQDLAGKM